MAVTQKMIIELVRDFNGCLLRVSRFTYSLTSFFFLILRDYPIIFLALKAFISSEQSG